MTSDRRRLLMAIYSGIPAPPYPDPYEDDGKVWGYINVSSDGTYRVANAGAANSGNGWRALEIDGVAVAGNRDQYLTAGEHLLKFTLATPSAMNGNLFRGIYLYSRIYLPNTITVLDNYCFYDCQSNSPIFMDTTRITSIGTSAFFHARVYIGKLNFPALTSMGNGAFYDYYAGTQNTIKDLGTITTIPQECFRNTRFSDNTYRIPATVTNIVQLSFYTDNYNLIYYCYPTTPPTLGSQVFRRNPSVIYVPASSVSAYQTASGWSSYASRIQAIP